MCPPPHILSRSYAVALKCRELHHFAPPPAPTRPSWRSYKGQLNPDIPSSKYEKLWMTSISCTLCPKSDAISINCFKVIWAILRQKWHILWNQQRGGEGKKQRKETNLNIPVRWEYSRPAKSHAFRGRLTHLDPFSHTHASPCVFSRKHAQPNSLKKLQFFV